MNYNIGDSIIDKSDAEYVRKRNSIIPDAARYADENSGPPPGVSGSIRGNPDRNEWCRRWNMIFARAMDRLMLERFGYGARKCLPENKASLMPDFYVWSHTFWSSLLATPFNDIFVHGEKMYRAK
jgi:hypothetical protein